MSSALRPETGLDLPPDRPPRVGIIGGGQLARMMAQAAVSLGVEVHVLAGSSDEGVPGVFASVTTGDPEDVAAIDAFADTVDVVTFDHENVSWEALDALVARGVIVHPGPETMRSADKALQREHLARAGLPLPPFEIVDPAVPTIDGVPVGRAVHRFVEAHGPKVIAKISRGGYDGRGVFALDGVDEVAGFVANWCEATRADGGASAPAGISSAGVRLVLEPALDLAAEVAVVTARRPGGEHTTYPVFETIQRNGMCNEVVVPARLDDSVVEEAGRVGAEVALAAPKIPVVNNIDVSIESEPERIRDALYRQAFGPVRWVETIQKIRAMGLGTVIECGPGKVLAGMTKRVDAELKGAAVYDPATLAEAKALVG